MFMIVWKPILKARAKEVNFLLEGQCISEDILQEYSALKISFAKISSLLAKELDESNAVLIMKEMLGFYQRAEMLMQYVLNEIFRDAFEELISERRAVFDLANRLLKLFVLFDLMKIRNPLVFCMYSKHKLLNMDDLLRVVNEIEDDKISVLGSICLPMGRLFLSMFSSDNFEISLPAILSKRSKIHLNTEKQKKLCLYGYMAEKFEWKYLLIFVGVAFKKMFGKSIFESDNEYIERFREYLVMLGQHL